MAILDGVEVIDGLDGIGSALPLYSFRVFGIAG